jgi:hypothetical protein
MWTGGVGHQNHIRYVRSYCWKGEKEAHHSLLVSVEVVYDFAHLVKGEVVWIDSEDVMPVHII